MRSLKATGFLLALGILAARSFAEDLQWRSATPIKAEATTATPASTPWNSAPTRSSRSTTSILSKPVPVTSITPVDYRGAVPLVRGTMADEVRDVKLPAGPPLPPDNTTIFGSDKPNTEVIPVKPREISNSSPTLGGGSTSLFSGPILGDDCCCGCSGDCCGCCGDCCGCFDNCCCCRDRGCFWFSAEYLVWGVSREHMPALLTTFPNGTSELDIQSGTALGARNIVDQNNLPSTTRSGARFTAGFWLPCCDCLGLEASYFFLARRSSSAFFNSPNGLPILAVPFIDDATGQQRFGITAHPGPPIAGSFAFNSSSYVWGVELNLRQKLVCGPCYFVDLLYGYRGIQVQDRIDILDVEAPFNGQAVQIWERFATLNQFNGAQVGIEGEWHFLPRWFLGGQAKLALGNVTETVTINGVAIPAFDIFGNSNLTLHAENNNIGKFQHNNFAVAPELSLKLGYDITDHLQFWVGYDVLFLSNVARAGDQIDTRFTLPNGQGPHPAVLFKTTSWTGQGLNIGLKYTF
jgi:hypothetical protein